MTTLTGREHGALIETKDRLLARFTELAAERDRPTRQEYTADRKELRWQRHEKLGMLTAVNNERALLGKPPVGIAVIKLAEQQACGHSDYADKWPFYCAEIVFGIFPLAREEIAKAAACACGEEPVDECAGCCRPICDDHARRGPSGDLFCAPDCPPAER
jgi:hypothetical protein